MSQNIPPSNDLHTSVMLLESVDALIGGNTGNTPKVFVDATVGLGGHSREILARMKPQDRLIVIDRDPENLKLAIDRLNDPRVSGYATSFGELSTIFKLAEISHIDGILYDLGVSSVHYDEPERGFSVRADGPLDMRFNRQDSSLPPASEWIKRIDERELFQGLKNYADEPKAYFIARAIALAREKQSINTTAALAKIIEEASFDPKSVIRSFQAIRIMVNQEFRAIEESIPQAVKALGAGGRLVVITFHSIEDRLIKTLAHVHETPEIDELTGRIITPAPLKKVIKKPLEPHPDEIILNPRSRSAKLRVYEKI